MKIVELSGYFKSDAGRWESLSYFRMPEESDERKKFMVEFPLQIGHGIEHAICKGDGMFEVVLTVFDELARDAMPKGWTVRDCVKAGTPVFIWRRMASNQQRAKGVTLG